MCILDRSRYTACCEINHIFRTESEDLIERVKSFQEERELYSSFDLQAEISIIVYPSIFDSSVCDLFLLLKHRYCFTRYLLTSFTTSKLINFDWQPYSTLEQNKLHQPSNYYGYYA